MGLWMRIKRMFFAGTGAALDKIENPEMVLQQTIRDMRERVPELCRYRCDVYLFQLQRFTRGHSE